MGSTRNDPVPLSLGRTHSGHRLHRADLGEPDRHRTCGVVVFRRSSRDPLAASPRFYHLPLSATPRRYPNRYPGSNRWRFPRQLAGFDLVAQQIKLPKMRRLPPEKVGRPDWHNAYSALTLDLRRRLDALDDDKAREALLAQLRAILGSAPPHA